VKNSRWVRDNDNEYLSNLIDMLMETGELGQAKSPSPSKRSSAEKAGSTRSTAYSPTDSAAVARIKKMRTVKADDNGSQMEPAYIRFARDTAAKLRFMADFTDDYTRDEGFDADLNLDQLSINQLRAYFTWRTRSRTGSAATKYPGFIILYMLEICSGIGVSSPDDGVRKLLRVWRDNRKHMTGLDEYAIQWIQWCYLCGDFKESFLEFTERYKLENEFPGARCVLPNKEYYLKLFQSIRSSKRKSRVMSRYLHASEGVADGFCCAVRGLRPLFSRYGIELPDLIRTTAFNRCNPFPNMLIEPAVPQPDRTVMLSAYEEYRLQNNRWSSNGVNMPVHTEELLTYVVIASEHAMCAHERIEPVRAPNREKTAAMLRQGPDTRLYLLFVDDRFDELMNESIALYIANSKKMKLTVLFGDARLTGPLSRRMDDENHAEPLATFIRMRSILRDRYSLDEQWRRFYNQAKILEVLELSETIEAANPIDTTVSYDALGDDGLKSYVAWRSRFRSGHAEPAVGLFALIHAAELMHGIGAKNPLDSMRKIARLLLLPGLDKRTESKLASWLRDYYVLHSEITPEKKPGRRRSQPVPQEVQDEKADMFTRPFLSHLYELNLLPKYPPLVIGCEREFAKDGQTLDYRALFDLYAGISSYKIGQSRFMDDYDKLARLCFAGIIDRVWNAFDKKDLSFTAFMITKKAGMKWSPFADAPRYDPALMPPQPDDDTIKTLRRFSLRVDLYRKQNAIEVFRFRGYGWGCASTAAMSPFAAHLVGYIMRMMEAKLRKLTGFKYKLSEPPSLMDSLSDASRRDVLPEHTIYSLKSLPLEEIIERAAVETFTALFPNGVHTESKRKPDKAKSDEGAPRPVAVRVDFTALDGVRSEADWVFGKLTEGSAEDPGPVQAAPAVANYTEESEDESLEKESWTDLSYALSALQKKALELLLSEDGSIAALALIEGGGVMPEPFFERINELSLKYVGDTLVESTGDAFELVDAYKDETRGMLA